MGLEEKRSYGHIPIYCINLPRSVERRQAISAQAETLGLDITFIEAVDGRTINPADVPEYFPSQRAHQGLGPLLPNALGCTLSHKRTLEIFLASGAQAAVILEDDAILEANFMTAIDAILNETWSWDLVKLWRVKKRKSTHLPVRSISGGFRLVAPLSTTHGTVAILYSRAGAEKALSSLSDFFEGVDTHLGRCWKTKLKILEIHPHVVQHADGVSTIYEMKRMRSRNRQSATLAQRSRRNWYKLLHATLNPVYVAVAAISVHIGTLGMRAHAPAPLLPQTPDPRVPSC